MTNLQKAWDERLELHAKAEKLRADALRLDAEYDKLKRECDRMWDEGDELRKKSKPLLYEKLEVYNKIDKLRAKNKKLRLWPWVGKLQDNHGGDRAEVCKLLAEVSILSAYRSGLEAEADRLQIQAKKIWANRENPWPNHGKLFAEADRLRGNGDLTFINAVIEKYGKEAAIEWTKTGAIVNGEEFVELTGGKDD